MVPGCRCTLEVSQDHNTEAFSFPALQRVQKECDCVLFGKTCRMVRAPECFVARIKVDHSVDGLMRRPEKRINLLISPLIA